MPETNEEALINNIDRVYESNGRYFILDKRMKQVLCYTLSGKHLFTIHAVGNGKGEYVDLFDIAINEAENKLLLLTYPNLITPLFICQRKFLFLEKNISYPFR